MILISFRCTDKGSTGKTTCLDVLAQRKNIGVVSGDVLVDGRPLPADFARCTAYGKSTAQFCLIDLADKTIAEQMDVHEGTEF
jgi:ATP-binding cassette subfamily G (WHITE) protein 2 (SNQ2)